MPAPPVLFVFVVTDPLLATGIMDLVTGKSQAELDAVRTQTQAELQHADAIKTAVPINT
jgi:hypothetical protein